MPDWPHSPLHRLTEAGAYMVTAGTYQKAPYFRREQRLTLLCEGLLRLTREHGWQLQAWAVFPNHYHFVATSPPEAQSLRALLRRLHAGTAKEINQLDHAPGRKVWFEYWDTRITNERSYFARLNYVHRNAVHHELVREPTLYAWCSAGWFAREAPASFRRTVMQFPCDRVRVVDDFQVEEGDVGKE